MPVSVTAQRTSAPSLVTSTSMLPPGGVYLTAFETRFCSTCRSIWASPITACSASRPPTRAGARACARPAACRQARPATSLRDVAAGRVPIMRPPSRRDTLSKSLTSTIGRSDGSEAVRHEPTHVGRALLLAEGASSSIHLMPVSGVRSWWLAKLTKSACILRAASNCSRARRRSVTSMVTPRTRRGPLSSYTGRA